MIKQVMRALTPIIIAIIANGPERAEAITGCTCRGNQTIVDTVDLLSAAECPNPRLDYEEAETRRMQVVHQIKNRPVRAIQCKFIYTRRVTYCGWFDSLTYSTVTLADDHVLYMPPKLCRRAYSQRVFRFADVDFKIDRVGVYQHYIKTAHGRNDVSGSCKGAAFNVGGTHFNSHYDEISAKFMVTELEGIYKEYDDEVVFPTIGVRAQYSKRSVFDAEEGALSWEKLEYDLKSCLANSFEVYEGNVTWHEPKNRKLNKPIVMIDGGESKGPGRGKQYAGFIITGEKQVCNKPCYTTQVENMVICGKANNNVVSAGMAIPSYNSRDPLTTDLQTQIAYLHLDTKLQFHHSLQEIVSRMCELEREILSNKLVGLAGGNPYFMLSVYGPCHMVIPYGAAAFVAKCTPVEMERVEYGKCTLEIPVRQLGRPEVQFLDPLTKIIQEYPTTVDCSSLMPVMWRLGDQWYCNDGTVHKCEAPKKLRAKTSLINLPALDLDNGITNGIYTEEQRKAFFKQMDAYGARKPFIVHSGWIAVKNARRDNDSWALGSAVPIEEWNYWKEDIADTYIPFHWLLGNVYATFVAVSVCLLLFKTGLGCTIRMYVMWRVKGTGVWLLGAIWSSFVHLAMVPVNIVGGVIQEFDNATRFGPGLGDNDEDKKKKKKKKGIHICTGHSCEAPHAYERSSTSSSSGECYKAPYKRVTKLMHREPRKKENEQLQRFVFGAMPQNGGTVAIGGRDAADHGRAENGYEEAEVYANVVVVRQDDDDQRSDASGDRANRRGGAHE